MLIGVAAMSCGLRAARQFIPEFAEGGTGRCAIRVLQPEWRSELAEEPRGSPEHGRCSRPLIGWRLRPALRR